MASHAPCMYSLLTTSTKGLSEPSASRRSSALVPVVVNLPSLFESNPRVVPASMSRQRKGSCSLSCAAVAEHVRGAADTASKT
eukprot:scaffold2290_cov62-Phaeocystis_antarctica.AAC.1